MQSKNHKHQKPYPFSVNIARGYSEGAARPDFYRCPLPCHAGEGLSIKLSLPSPCSPLPASPAVHMSSCLLPFLVALVVCCLLWALEVGLDSLKMRSCTFSLKTESWRCFLMVLCPCLWPIGQLLAPSSWSSWSGSCLGWMLSLHGFLPPPLSSLLLRRWRVFSDSCHPRYWRILWTFFRVLVRRGSRWLATFGGDSRGYLLPPFFVPKLCVKVPGFGYRFGHMPLLLGWRAPPLLAAPHEGVCLWDIATWSSHLGFSMYSWRGFLFFGLPKLRFMLRYHIFAVWSARRSSLVGAPFGEEVESCLLDVIIEQA